MNRAILLCLPLLFAGCGGPPPSDPEPSSNVIGDPLMQSLDKTRAVEDLSGARKGDLDEAIGAN